MNEPLNPVCGVCWHPLIYSPGYDRPVCRTERCPRYAPTRVGKVSAA